MAKTWIIQPPWEGCARASAQWGVSALVAQLLHNRQVRSAADAQMFLSPQLSGLLPPETLPGAAAAAEMLAAAVKRGSRIVLYGDYDVDGITGVAILWHVLRVAGAEVSFYVPHRLEEGYGLNAAALEQLAAEGAELVVTVDCGITAVEEARLAQARGLRLIVTDHHEAREVLPAAAAIVHPRVGGAYENPHLCGAGVAFKLAWSFARRMSGAERVTGAYKEQLTRALPLAALGTIADVVPLIGENRVLTRCGLARIKDCGLPGLRALLEVAELVDAPIDGTAVGFKLAPRINAAGRMGHARLAIELLTRADENRAREIALYLDEHNRARQSKERQHARQACELVERGGFDGDTRRAIVLAEENWHPGVIGIVAGRLVERYHKPTVLIALENGVGQGSARSVPHFALHEALAACSAHLLSHGGHAMAAGLKIAADAVPAFTEAFVRYANNALSGTAVRPTLRLDGEVALADLNERTVAAIRELGPFGAGNPKPLLATDWVQLVGEPRCVGKNGEHLQFTVAHQGAELKGIAFRAAEQAEPLKEHRRCRVAFEPILSEFNGRRRVELQAIDFRFPDDE